MDIMLDTTVDKVKDYFKHTCFIVRKLKSSNDKLRISVNKIHVFLLLQ